MRARIDEDAKGRRLVSEACVEPCAIERGMRIIGGKWTGSILWHLKDGPVTVWFRSGFSLKRPSFRRPMDFSSPRLSVVDVDCRTR